MMMVVRRDSHCFLRAAGLASLVRREGDVGNCTKPGNFMYRPRNAAQEMWLCCCAPCKGWSLSFIVSGVPESCSEVPLAQLREAAAHQGPGDLSLLTQYVLTTYCVLCRDVSGQK